MWTVQRPIFRFGSDEQRGRYLPELCRGNLIGAHGMTEPESGSDAFSLRTTAKRRGDFYILNGSKTFLNFGSRGRRVHRFCHDRQDQGIPRDYGLHCGAWIPWIPRREADREDGITHGADGRVSVRGLPGPCGQPPGEGGQWRCDFNDAASWERTCILASLIGAMERQLATCISYAQQRRQFQKPIGKFQSIANRIADMKVRLETSRLILYRAGWAKQQQRSTAMESAVAKLYLSEAWVKSCLDAVQIHGGYGYTVEYEQERDLRDAVGSTIYSGTSEIQRNIIASNLGL